MIIGLVSGVRYGVSFRLHIQHALADHWLEPGIAMIAQRLLADVTFLNGRGSIDKTVQAGIFDRPWVFLPADEMMDYVPSSLVYRFVSSGCACQISVTRAVSVRCRR